MNRKSSLVVAILALGLLCTAGTLLASNMGFKLNYQLTGPAGAGGVGTGKQLLALPYIRQNGINDFHRLILDIGGGTVTPVNNVARYNKATDTTTSYTGRRGPAVAPALVAGEGYIVQMNQNVNYILVGFHDPSVAVPLTGPAAAGGAGTGKQIVSVPFNSTARDVFELMLDIGGGSVTPVVSVSKFNKATDTTTSYNGRMGAGTPFALVPGEAYVIQMSSNVPYIASHY